MMKKNFLLTLILANVISVNCQEIKKMNVRELESYITQCDHPLIVNFWATYCGPCVKEIPYFQTLIDKHKESKIELLLVSLDLPNYYPARISTFAKNNQLSARIV